MVNLDDMKTQIAVALIADIKVKIYELPPVAFCEWINRRTYDDACTLTQATLANIQEEER